MTKQTNPFLQSKYLYEKVDRRKGLEYLNNDIVKKLGKAAFFDFDERVFKGHFLADSYSDLESAVDHHLYYREAYGGSCDYLNVSYGVAFKELWDILPGQPWIMSCLNKDFRAVPVDLIYTEAAEGFKDTESAALVWETLKSAAEKGWICFNNHKDCAGRIHWRSLAIIEDKKSEPLLGLKERILIELPEICSASKYKNSELFWEKEYLENASRVVAYTVYQVFNNYITTPYMQNNKWEGLLKQAAPLMTYFRKSFDSMTFDEQTNIINYAGFTTKEPEKWIGNFTKVLHEKRTLLSFIMEFKDVQSQHE